MRVKFVLLCLPLVTALLSACDAESPVAAVPAAADAVQTAAPEAAAPIPVKVVVVTMFEPEVQLWHERLDLDQMFEFAGEADLRLDSETGVLVMMTGIGTAKSTASVMMLGMDPRFDLSKAYWLVAGIAGIDPEDASFGSVAWAEYLVDGDLAHEIDPREIPEDWEYGYFARHTQKPFDENKPEPTGEMFRTNAALTEWAYQLTKDIALPDSEQLSEARALWTEHPNALKPPFVLRGDHLAAMTFWHGSMMNDWANDWVDYWSDGDGNFVTSAMEETGTMQALTWLTKAGRADRDRLMVLRAGSNYTVPPPGVDAATNLLAEEERYSALNESVESLYIVGSKVIETILAGWDNYGDRTPIPADVVSP